MKELLEAEETREQIIKKLLGLIDNGSENLMLITAFRMAKRDLENGDLASAIGRMLSDADKIGSQDKELWDYLIKHKGWKG